MKIVVASSNPVKLKAVETAFADSFEGEALSVESVESRSGVSDQPTSDEETRHGAVNRSRHAMELAPDADFWVGIEGGVEAIGDGLVAFAWVAIRRKGGRSGQARTVTLPLPPAIRRLIDDGLELGEANDRVFETSNSKQGGGAFGLLTGGRYTRESVYVQAISIALIPIVNPLYD
ncbi:MAG: inosine/xanthosine triphosphatase [Woeseiaceae bacterium]|nr:inosine/xanthosine triphosphatase [Woeseiaceae bacterium]